VLTISFDKLSGLSNGARCVDSAEGLSSRSLLSACAFTVGSKNLFTATISEAEKSRKILREAQHQTRILFWQALAQDM
jgi:cobalamin biosynthesis protein CbiD